jgi:hypothetical protein
MPKLSDYVRRAEGQEKGDKGGSTRLEAAEAAEAAPPPPRPLPATTTTAASAATPRYRDRATGKLLPKGVPAPPRPRAHVESRREWRGLVRYCCAAVSAATGRAVPLPPDAEGAGGDEKEGEQEEQEDELVPALEDPEAPWGAHYAALLKRVRVGGGDDEAGKAVA